MFNPRLHPFSQTVLLQADTADVLFNIFRVPTAGQILAVYAVNDATVDTATNMINVTLVSRGTTGTETATTIADFASATGWTADVPRTGSLTAANQKVATATWLAINYNETGTETATRMTIQFDYLLNAYEN